MSSILADLLVKAAKDRLSAGELNALWKEASQLAAASKDLGAVVGRAGNVKRIAAGNVEMSPSAGIILYNPATGKPSIHLEPDGDASFGSDIDAPATTSLKIFSNEQTYNSELMGAGDVLFGDNSSSKANLVWDRSTGKLNFRGGTTVQAYVGTDGKIYAGGGSILLGESGIIISGTSQLILFKVNPTTDFPTSSLYRTGTGIRLQHATGTSTLGHLEVADGSITFNPDYLATTLTLTDPGSGETFRHADVSGYMTVSKYLSVTGDIYTVAWTDYSGTSTIVGWSSYTTQKIFYKKVGKLVFVEFSLSGTSNSATTTFTLPFARHNNGYSLKVTIQITDNGAIATGLFELPSNSSTVTFYSTLGEAGWTASGTKGVIGEFCYEAA